MTTARPAAILITADKQKQGMTHTCVLAARYNIVLMAQCCQLFCKRQEADPLRVSVESYRQ